MHELTAEGRALVEQVSQRHNVSADAVLTLLRALDRGGGTQAQFSHPDLGGMGQWSRGGMIMVGDMFNNGLKARVDAVCTALSDALRTSSLFKKEATDDGGSWGGSNWWPAGCGTPSSTGSQNDMSYAFFPDSRRLALRHGGTVTLYDTGDHRIGGVSQQQSGSQDLTFTSQYGTVRLHEFARVGDAPVPAMATPTTDRPASAPPTAAPPPQAPRTATVPQEPSPSLGTEDDVFAKIERLHALHQKGILSDAEFAEKKAELLARI